MENTELGGRVYEVNKKRHVGQLRVATLFVAQGAQSPRIGPDRSTRIFLLRNRNTGILKYFHLP